jgi:hypothetical protein
MLDNDKFCKVEEEKIAEQRLGQKPDLKIQQTKYSDTILAFFKSFDLNREELEILIDGDLDELNDDQKKRLQAIGREMKSGKTKSEVFNGLPENC